ncbi:hypothetical protein OPQ81_007151 [Rhizoctonia solani]|nr:hypothetical protein OPQ81_007151 [Rhizoctonia solani]
MPHPYTPSTTEPQIRINFRNSTSTGVSRTKGMQIKEHIAPYAARRTGYFQSYGSFWRSNRFELYLTGVSTSEPRVCGPRRTPDYYKPTSLEQISFPESGGYDRTIVSLRTRHIISSTLLETSKPRSNSQFHLLI